MPRPPARLGRPSREEAARLAERVLAEATRLMLRDGYARTSMESVAAASGVSKRTLYKYHPDKPALLRAAIAALIRGWRPPFDAEPADPADLRTSLVHLARRMLAVALTPEALALHRLAVSEAARFPEIVASLSAAGVATGVERIAVLIGAVARPGEAVWAAEQFQRLVVAGPQQRALGFGEALTTTEQDDWARRSVALFLDGLGAAPP